jgi:hypothetical protein
MEPINKPSIGQKIGVVLGATACLLAPRCFAVKAPATEKVVVTQTGQFDKHRRLAGGTAIAVVSGMLIASLLKYRKK